MRGFKAKLQEKKNNIGKSWRSSENKGVWDVEAKIIQSEKTRSER